jgi:hypothetical protein
MVAVTLMWTAMSGNGREGYCVADHDRWCRSVPALAFILGGFVVGVPWGAIVGAFVGWLAHRLRRHRRLVLLAIATGAASGCEAIAGVFTRCSTDPSRLALWSTALVAFALAALALDRAERSLGAGGDRGGGRDLPL